MQNFSPENIHARLTALEEAIARHVPAGVGGDLEIGLKLLDERVARLEHEVFGAAGVGAAQEAGAFVDAQSIAADKVGVYEGGKTETVTAADHPADPTAPQL